ncbi:MAG: hypothetical protein ACK4NZ_02045 [Tsuneonella sp.]
MTKQPNSSRKRVHTLATLGGELSSFQIGYEDRHALRAVLRMHVTDFYWAMSAAQIRDAALVGEAIARLIQLEHLPLSTLGKSVLFDRQAATYRADCESWEEQPHAIKTGRWRQARATRDQRMLMIRMAQTHGLSLPGDVTRGEAHDWIKANGGNPRYSEEQKS